MGVVVGGGGGRGEVAGPPVGAVEDGGGADVDEGDRVAWSEVVLEGPLHYEGAFVA